MDKYAMGVLPPPMAIFFFWGINGLRVYDGSSTDHITY